MAVVCWPVKEAMSSLSSSGTVVSVLVSPSSCPPPEEMFELSGWRPCL